MTSLPELINQMREQQAQKGFTGTCLLVGMENESVVVFADDPDPLEKLSQAVRTGGEPIAMIAWGQNPLKGGRQEIWSSLLPEFKGQEWAKDYVKAFLEIFKTQMTKAGYPGWKKSKGASSN